MIFIEFLHVGIDAKVATIHYHVHEVGFRGCDIFARQIRVKHLAHGGFIFVAIVELQRVVAVDILTIDLPIQINVERLLITGERIARHAAKAHTDLLECFVFVAQGCADGRFALVIVGQLLPIILLRKIQINGFDHRLIEVFRGIKTPSLELFCIRADTHLVRQIDMNI